MASILEFPCPTFRQSFAPTLAANVRPIAQARTFADRKSRLLAQIDMERRTQIAATVARCDHEIARLICINHPNRTQRLAAVPINAAR